MGMTLMCKDYLLGLLSQMPNGREMPRVFIETGAFEGNTAKTAVDIFDEVHTIELSPEFFQRMTPGLTEMGIKCHLGDSANVLPEILDLYPSEPVVAYLDAHWFWRADDLEQIPDESPFPLWAELAAIKPRRQADCVIVDDARIFGKGQGDLSYPLDDRWRDVTEHSIVEALGADRVASSGIIGDACVVWRTEI